MPLHEPCGKDVEQKAPHFAKKTRCFMLCHVTIAHDCPCQKELTRHRCRTPHHSGPTDVHLWPSLGQPAFIYHGGLKVHQLRVPRTAAGNRLEPDLPLTRLPIHNPQTVCTLCFRSLRNVFGLLRYIVRSYVYRILNRITCLLLRQREE
jgi:hypothetical protein